jgi:hypothetical protein
MHKSLLRMNFLYLLQTQLKFIRRNKFDAVKTDPAHFNTLFILHQTIDFISSSMARERNFSSAAYRVTTSETDQCYM